MTDKCRGCFGAANNDCDECQTRGTGGVKMASGYYRKRGEDTEQELVISWANWHLREYPALKWLHHIPNGGKRNTAEAARFKAQGVKAGVSDLFLPAAHGGYFGLYIEMKYGKNKPTDQQREFMQDMMYAGYKTAVAYSADEAITILREYLQERETKVV